MKLKLSILAAALALMAAPLSRAQFAKVDNGPSTNSNCQSAPALYYDQVNQILMSCGNLHTRQVAETALGVFNAQTAVTSVTTAQTMASLALNANEQNYATRKLEICGSGVYTSPGTTAPTMTIQLIEGGITPIAITTAALSTTATTSAPFSFCFSVTTVATGSTGTLESHGWLMANIAAATPAAAVAVYLDTNTAVSSSINLTAANTLAVQVAASSSLTSVTLRQLSIELVS